MQVLGNNRLGTRAIKAKLISDTVKMVDRILQFRKVDIRF